MYNTKPLAYLRKNRDGNYLCIAITEEQIDEIKKEAEAAEMSVKKYLNHRFGDLSKENK